jgi:predicted nucleic acid-binding protein
MLYLDASLAVTLITPEPHTTAARAWLAEQEPIELSVSDWVLTEVSSALSIKQRRGALDERGRVQAQRTFDELVHESFQVLDVPRVSFRHAAAMAGQPALGLRSGDALHLAIAQHHGARLCTRDDRQAEAGRRVGIDVFLLTGTAP